MGVTTASELYSPDSKDDVTASTKTCHMCSTSMYESDDNSTSGQSDESNFPLYQSSDDNYSLNSNEGMETGHTSAEEGMSDYSDQES